MQWLQVDAGDVSFTKSKYSGDTVRQFSEKDKRLERRGRFFIELQVRLSEKNPWTRRSKIGTLSRDGFYLTYAAASREVLDHQMNIEGRFERREGKWYEQVESAGADEDGGQNVECMSDDGDDSARETEQDDDEKECGYSEEENDDADVQQSPAQGAVWVF
jgi:hypothetical protein